MVSAQKYHEQLLELREDFKLETLANGCINPCYRTIRHWHDVWRNLNLGPRTGDGLIKVGIFKHVINKFIIGNIHNFL